MIFLRAVRRSDPTRGVVLVTVVRKACLEALHVKLSRILRDLRFFTGLILLGKLVQTFIPELSKTPMSCMAFMNFCLVFAHLAALSFFVLMVVLEPVAALMLTVHVRRQM